MMRPPRRIGIVGHVGNGNLGDEAIIAALLQGVREAVPGAEFAAFTIRPADTEARHGIPSYPLRRGIDVVRTAPPAVTTAGSAESGGLRSALRGIPGLGYALSRVAAAVRWSREMAREAAFWSVRYRHMRRVDLLIVAGSNQLSDYYGGAWGFPYTLLAWTVAARLAGARVAFLSVGAGPIRARSSGLMIRMALALSAYRSYRDTGSRDAVEKIGVRGPHILAPDLAHGLRLSPPPRAAAAEGLAPLIVINPLPYFDPRSWAERDPAIYRRYVETMASFTVGLQGRGYRVRFVPTQLRADPLVITDILEAVGERSGAGEGLASLRSEVTSFEDLVQNLSAADIVVAARFHGALISQMLGRPTIGIVYRRSTRDLLVDVGQGAYAIDIAGMTSETLLERLAALEKDREAGDRIQRRLEAYRKELAAQYASLLRTPRKEG